MLNVTTITDGHLSALACWITDLLIQREKHGYYVKSRVETPIRPLQIDGSDETFPGFPALTAIIGDAYGCDRATAVALLQRVALTHAQEFGWTEEVVTVPVYDPATRKPILDATGAPVKEPQVRHKMWLRSRIRDMVAASDPRARLRVELAQQLPAPPL
jgi:hypothetical protein